MGLYRGHPAFFQAHAVFDVKPLKITEPFATKGSPQKCALLRSMRPSMEFV